MIVGYVSRKFHEVWSRYVFDIFERTDMESDRQTYRRILVVEVKTDFRLWHVYVCCRTSVNTSTHERTQREREREKERVFFLQNMRVEYCPVRSM